MVESPKPDDRPQGIRLVSNFRQRNAPPGSMSPTSLKAGPFSREAPMASIRRRTDSTSTRSWCPSRTTALIVAVVLGAFALGLYISGLIHLIIDVGQIAQPGSNRTGTLFSSSHPSSPDDIAKAVKVVEDEWRKKYNDLLTKLNNAKDELHGGHEVRKDDKVVKVEGSADAPPDSSQNAAEKEDHKESSKKKQQMKDMLKQSELSGSNGKKDEKKDDPSEDQRTPISRFSILPSSSIWCEGNTLASRTCKFRNLCYNPEKERWFVLKTRSSTFENVPDQHQRTGLLEAGTVAGHPWVRFYVDEVSPFSSGLLNLNVRYETDLHFMTKRLHPHNIMHNLHDDTIPLFHWIKHFIGKGDYEYRMPFSLNMH
ncbi:Protein O-linked-mannose beta-1,4-N-acetylglucosaminyltransferase 2, partial [Dinochytrium kinnereticum]